MGFPGTSVANLDKIEEGPTVMDEASWAMILEWIKGVSEVFGRE